MKLKLFKILNWVQLNILIVEYLVVSVISIV